MHQERDLREFPAGNQQLTISLEKTFDEAIGFVTRNHEGENESTDGHRVHAVTCHLAPSGRRN